MLLITFSIELRRRGRVLPKSILHYIGAAFYFSWLKFSLHVLLECALKDCMIKDLHFAICFHTDMEFSCTLKFCILSQMYALLHSILQSAYFKNSGLWQNSLCRLIAYCLLRRSAFCQFSTLLLTNSVYQNFKTMHSQNFVHWAHLYCIFQKMLYLSQFSVQLFNVLHVYQILHFHSFTFFFHCSHFCAIIIACR